MPINTAKNIIILRAPAYASEPRLDDLIALAELELSQPVFGDKYNTAVALKVLHMLTKENTGGAAGAIASEKEGDLARSYHKSGDETDLGSTGYGQELKKLINNCVFAPRTNRMGSSDQLS